jgi:hypothetical protein
MGINLLVLINVLFFFLPSHPFNFIAETGMATRMFVKRITRHLNSC